MISDLLTQTAIVKRRSPGAYLMGRWVEGTETEITITCSLQPASTQSLMALPEGRRSESVYDIYTETPLQSAEEGEENADTIEIEGEKYEIGMVKKWSVGFLNHYHCIAYKVLSEVDRLDNVAPVAQNISITLDRNDVFNGNVTATDDNNDNLTYSIVVAPQYGTLNFNLDGSYSYTHDGSINLADSFTFKANDGLLDSNVATVSIAIENQAPVANNASIDVDRRGTTSGMVTATDPNNDALTYILVNGPNNGVLILNANGSYTYTHNGSVNLNDSFTFKANDGIVDSNVATASIAATNTQPVANNVIFNLSRGDSLSESVTFSDVNSDPLTATVVTQPNHGTLSIAANGDFTYAHDGSVNLSDSFTYKVNDGIDDSNIATITLNINNDAPVAVGESFTIDQNETFTGSLAGNDIDANNDVLTYIKVTDPSTGTLTISSNGDFTYVNDGTLGNDTFTYKVNDGVDDSNIVTVNLTIELAQRPWEYSDLGAKLLLYIDPTDTGDINGVDIVQTTGPAINRILNKGSLVTNAETDSGTSQKPTYTEQINGKNVVSFDGIQRFLFNDFSQITSLFMTQFTTDSFYLWFNIGSPAQTFIANLANTSTSLDKAVGNPTYYVDGALASWTDRDSIYQSMHNRNAIWHATDFDFSAWTGQVRMGDFGAFAGKGLPLIGTSDLTQDEMDRTVGKMHHDMGLQGNLAPTHPYKNNPPMI